jgi:hypothetical protein
MPIPLAALIALGAVGQGASAAAGAMSGKRQQKQDAASLALEESQLDPNRHQMSQARNIGLLDMMQHASFSPTTVAPPARYADQVPQIAMTPSYAPSADVRSSAGAIKSSVMAGRTTPTMMDPKNHGRTGALDMMRIAAGADPGSEEAFATPTPAGLSPGQMNRQNALGNWRRQKWLRENPGWEMDAFGSPRRTTAPRPWEA